MNGQSPHSLSKVSTMTSWALQECGVTNTEEMKPELTWTASRLSLLGRGSTPRSRAAGWSGCKEWVHLSRGREQLAGRAGSRLKPTSTEKPAKGRTGREVANNVIQVLFIYKEHSERARKGKVTG